VRVGDSIENKQASLLV